MTIETSSQSVRVLQRTRREMWSFSNPTIWHGGVENFLARAPEAPLFDLVITSPPYNIGKQYEKQAPIGDYLRQQRKIISAIVERMQPNGSVCWQVGNYVSGGEILPLDLEFHKIFRKLGLKLRNRIIWHFGHGLHNTRRFSGRYEVVLWYTMGTRYKFNLDAIRVPSKYPGKRHFKGPKKGLYSSHPLGKNPEDVWQFSADVWNIPNVKGNHVEKTCHPCQFPVGLAERLILALSDKNDVVFDPFTGVASAGVAALLHGRRFVGCERSDEYVAVAKDRLENTISGSLKYRPHHKPIYDHTKSRLSIPPLAA